MRTPLNNAPTSIGGNRAWDRRVDFRSIRPTSNQSASRSHSSDVIARLDPAIYPHAKELGPLATSKGRINFIGIHASFVRVPEKGGSSLRP